MTGIAVATQPLFELVIPSNMHKVKVRPMLVKEEKILLMAKEGKEDNQILLAVKQVVNNCLAVNDPKINVNLLTTFDIEYLFLHIRAQSVDNVLKPTYRDAEDGKDYTFEIDLNKVEVKKPENVDMHIDIGGDRAVTLKYPTAALYENKVFASSTKEEEVFQELVISCLDTISQGEQTNSFRMYKREDIIKFIDNLTIPSYNKIREFFANMPSLFYEIKYKNDLGNEKTITLRTLFDFFTF